MKKKYLLLFLSTILIITTCALIVGCGKKDNPPDDKKEYTISFYVDGECVKTVKSKGNEEIEFPENPTKDGYAFVGWSCTFSNGYTEPYFSSSYYKTIPMTEDVKAVAQWKKKITIHFEMNGGQMAGAGVTGPLPDETILEGNKSDRIRTVITKGDSAFMGWYDNPELEGDKITDPYYPTDNVTLYAAWLDESRVMPEGGLWLDYYQEYEGYVAWMYDGEPTELVIPSSYKGIPIVRIAYPFYFKNYQTINNTVTTIKTSKNLKSIASTAFQGCNKLTSVIISDTVEEIGAAAFDRHTLENLTISDNNSLKYIGGNAFGNVNDYYKPKWSENLPDGAVYLGKILYGYKGTIEGSFTVKAGTTAIAGRALYNQSKMTSLTIPEGVKIIGDEAFGNCSALKTINMPDTLTNIYSYAFYNCSALETFVMPNSITGIGDGTFKGCTNLKSITLSENLTGLSFGMFENCSITELIVPEKVTFIGNAFLGNTTLQKITIKNANIDFDELALGNIPESITAIYVHSDLVDSFKTQFPAHADKFFAIAE